MIRSPYFFLRIPSLIGLSVLLYGCASENPTEDAIVQADSMDSMFVIDTALIPDDKDGEYIRYGRALLLNTAYYIGPEGVAGRYLGNKMNCSNCHQEAGTKPFSISLLQAHDRYPQYRSREGKVLSLAERVNNCVERPHLGKPLPLDSKEMVSILSYLKWINSFVPPGEEVFGAKPAELGLPAEAASSERGGAVFEKHCKSCHGSDGQGVMQADGVTYQYPPLWGEKAYQMGSSMHRNIKLAQWIKSNMPYLLARWDAPVLTDQEALDVAAFINDDAIHSRPKPIAFDYPDPKDKPIDYPIGPFVDTFSASAHRFGPYEPIIGYWKEKGWKPVY